jgi:hypothetical protein
MEVSVKDPGDAPPALAGRSLVHVGVERRVDHVGLIASADDVRKAALAPAAHLDYGSIAHLELSSVVHLAPRRHPPGQVGDLIAGCFEHLGGGTRAVAAGADRHHWAVHRHLPQPVGKLA